MKSNPNGQILRRVLRRNVWPLAALASLGPISGLAAVAVIVVLSASLAQSTPWPRELLPYLFVAATTVMLITQYGHIYLSVAVGSRIAGELRTETLRQILGASVRTIEVTRSSGVFTVLTHDLGAISEFISIVPPALASTALLTGVFTYLAVISDHDLFMGLIVITALGIALYSYFAKGVQRLFDQLRDRSTALLHSYSELLDGVNEIKLDPGLGNRLSRERVQPVIAALNALNEHVGRSHALGITAGQIAVYLIIGFVVFAYPRLALVGDGVILSFALAIIYVTGRIQFLIDAFPLVARVRASLWRIAALRGDLQDANEQLDDSANAPPLPLSVGIELRHATFRFDGDVSDRRFSLGPIDLGLRCGEIVFIGGPNGSGKSTLAKCICGLYSLSAGELWCDRRCVDRSQLVRFRRNVSAVLTQYHVFEHLVDPPSNATAVTLGRLFDLEGVLEGGSVRPHEISAGQRKRLALLISLSAERQIYVLDEPCGDLDPDYKRIFYTKVLDHLRDRGKLVVVVTHDDNYFHVCDRLITMRNGLIESDVRMDGVSRAGQANIA